MILKVSDLWVETDAGIPLVRGVSFSVRQGEIVGLVGQSGSGKSIMSLAIAGLLPKGISARGSVVLNGREIIGAGERQLNEARGRDAAIVFQEPGAALDPLMRIEKQIALPLKRHRALCGEKLRQAVYALLEEVRLGDGGDDARRIARSLPHEISGGQRQRTAIAMALACSPKLLIADEPTSATDAQVQKQIVSLIRETARRRNIGALFISHDIAVVHSIAERILVMKDGLIVEEAAAGDLVNNPRHEYTRLLVRCAKLMDLALKKQGA